MGMIIVLVTSLITSFAFSNLTHLPRTDMAALAMNSGRVLSSHHRYKPSSRVSVIVDIDGLDHPTADNTHPPKRDRSREILLSSAISPEGNMEKTAEKKTQAEAYAAQTRSVPDDANSGKIEQKKAQAEFQEAQASSIPQTSNDISRPNLQNPPVLTAQTSNNVPESSVQNPPPAPMQETALQMLSEQHQAANASLPSYAAIHNIPPKYFAESAVVRSTPPMQTPVMQTPIHQYQIETAPLPIPVQNAAPKPLLKTRVVRSKPHQLSLGRKVRDAILKYPRLSKSIRLTLRVTSSKDKVTLNGIVASKRERVRIGRLTRQIVKSKKIENRLVVVSRR